MANNERTYIMIKPDGVQRGLVGEIIKRFENRGYQLTALKLKQVNKNSQQALKDFLYLISNIFIKF